MTKQINIKNYNINNEFLRQIAENNALSRPLDTLISETNLIDDIVETLISKNEKNNILLLFLKYNYNEDYISANYKTINQKISKALTQKLKNR